MRTFVLTLSVRGAGGLGEEILHAQFRDERRAREFAATRLSENPAIVSITIAEGGRELARLERE